MILESEFSAAHFYNQPLWSKEKNREVFGRCFTEFGHGHNYLLKSEWVVPSLNDIVELRKQVESIVSKVDHEHLNFVIPEFENKIPTTEVILDYFETQMKKNVSFKLINLELFETPEIGAKLF